MHQLRPVALAGLHRHHAARCWLPQVRSLCHELDMPSSMRVWHSVHISQKVGMIQQHLIMGTFPDCTNHMQDPTRREEALQTCR